MTELQIYERLMKLFSYVYATVWLNESSRIAFAAGIAFCVHT